MICEYIADHRERFGVEPICAVLSTHGVPIAPGTYYKWLTKPLSTAVLEEAYLVNSLVDLYRRNKRVYGVRKLWKAARRAGLQVGRDQVGRLMRIAGIQGAHRATTTTRDERAPRHPDLVRRGWKTPNRPDAVWVADFTYVWTAAGFCYVSFITDVYSRRILGWKASMDKTTDLVTADAGSQYTALAFTEALADAGIAGSIGTVGDALDNALMESTIGLYKTELINTRGRGRNWSGRAEVERETAEWVRWYNNERIHSSIDYLTPIEREVVYAQTIAQRVTPAVEVA